MRYYRNVTIRVLSGLNRTYIKKLISTYLSTTTISEITRCDMHINRTIVFNKRVDI